MRVNISEENYLEPPPGYDDLAGKIFRPNKSLYGVCQASHLEFNKLFSRTLLSELGFEQSAVDLCVLRPTGSEDRKVEVLLLFHVDDFMVADSV